MCLPGLLPDFQYILTNHSPWFVILLRYQKDENQPFIIFIANISRILSLHWTLEILTSLLYIQCTKFNHFNSTGSFKILWKLCHIWFFLLTLLGRKTMKWILHKKKWLIVFKLIYQSSTLHNLKEFILKYLGVIFI